MIPHAYARGGGGMAVNGWRPPLRRHAPRSVSAQEKSVRDPSAPGEEGMTWAPAVSVAIHVSACRVPIAAHARANVTTTPTPHAA
jgi:hypothetical protein